MSSRLPLVEVVCGFALAMAGQAAVGQSCPDASVPMALNSTAAADSGNDRRVQLASDGLGTWVAVWASTENLGGTVGTDFDIFSARSVDDGATWSAAATLNSNAGTDSGLDTTPRLATDGLGHWIAVWISNDSLGGTIGTDFDLLYVRSSDNGQTWTSPQPLNTSAGSDTQSDVEPDLATDGAGLWLAVWSGTAPANTAHILGSVSTDDGQTWSPQTPLFAGVPFDAGTVDSSPKVATDGSGTWLLAWSSSESLGGTIGTDRDILFARSTDSAVTWTAPAALNSGAAADSGLDYSPDVATDGQGSWLVNWHSNEGTDFDILYARSLDDAVTWSSQAPLNSNAGTDSGADLEARVETDGQGNWVAVWESTSTVGGAAGPDKDVLISLSTNDGSSWSDPSALYASAATDSGADESAAISFGGLGLWLVAWESTQNVGGASGTDYDLLISSFGVSVVDCDGNGVPDDCQIDTDDDGLINPCDADDDNDGVADAVDVVVLNPQFCEDSDGDTCDDCAVGVDGFGPLPDQQPANDGPDTDGDGLCNAGDGDDDNDGVADGPDPGDLNPNACGDSDGDACDDCAVGVDGFGPLPDQLPASDGPDTDGDGLCNAGDGDDDNDGGADGSDPDDLNPDVCGDSDGDTCDDCSVGTDGYGALSDLLPANDGPDGDGDGSCDAGDPCPADNPDDSDNDGVCESADVCPGGDDLLDGDGDGVPDFCDVCPKGNDHLDTDGDGVPNFCDACPGFDDAIDADGDGSPDACDSCPTDNPDDTDGDGVCESADTCPGGDDLADGDGDWVADFCDACLLGDDALDADGDGVADACDACPGSDDSLDADGDSVPDACDACPGFDDAIDADGDGSPDACDSCPTDNPDDTDGDGVCESADACPGGDDLADGDADGVADFCDACAGSDDALDADGDDVPDGCDACAGFDDSLDADGDGAPDACDVCAGGDDALDGDSDGVPDACDPCPQDNPDDSDGDAICNSSDLCPGGDDSEDNDGDSVPDFCDSCPLDNPDDSDGDTVCDGDDICPGADDLADADSDGVPDVCDACPGGDDHQDEDGDGAADLCDPCPVDNPDDSDGDGVCDVDDACPGGDDLADADGDGAADLCDDCPGFDDNLDADGDTVPDGCDACPGFDDLQDTDLDGAADACDACPIDTSSTAGPCMEVLIRSVVRHEPTGLDETAGFALPPSEVDQLEGGCFVVEIWAMDVTPQGNGLSCVFTDVLYGDAACPLASSPPSFDGLFTEFSSGLVTNSPPASAGVDELGACTLNAGVGVGRWALVAVLHMDTAAGGFTPCAAAVFLADANTDSSLFSIGIADLIDLGQVDDVTVFDSGVVYNIDAGISGDTFVGPGDFSFFAECWMELAPLGSCADSDFDCDGAVGPGDLSFFATAWLREVSDPGIVVPACQFFCGSAQEAGAAAMPWAGVEEMSSFGLPIPPPEWAGWDLDPARQSTTESKPRSQHKHPKRPSRAAN